MQAEERQTGNKQTEERWDKEKKMPEIPKNNMMDSLFNSDPTDFEELPSHVITTDHPYMASLGLSTFSTGTLYRW